MRPNLHSFGHTASPPAFAAGMIYPARSAWYWVQICAACPASGRVCRALRGLSCIWRGLSCCLSCAAVPGALGAGVSTGGVYSRRPAPPGQSFNHRKNKKGSKFSAKTKRPLQRVCVLCYTCLTSLEREESVMNQKNDKNKEKREKNEKIATSIWGIIIAVAVMACGAYLMIHGIASAI